MVLIPSDAGLNLRQPGDAALLPVARSPAIPADLPDLRQGQNFTATIQQVLPENTYLALVAGKSVTLSLPGSAKAGDTLELVVVDRTARGFIAQLADLAQGQRFSAVILEALPGNVYKALVDGKPVTLQLDLPAAAGDQLDLQVVAQTPGLITAQLATSRSDSGSLYQYTSLSRAGQLIGQLLVAEGETPPAAALNRGQPLLAQPPADAKELAPALAEAAGKSGLFYEAHQAQWVAGKLPLEALLQEPQAQHTAQPQATAAGANTVPIELRPLVQQQLDAVATQRLIWQGEVWPGQTMDWQVEQQPEGHGQGAAEQRWATTLRLTTPRLGQIQAALNLAGGGVRIALTAPSGATAADLSAATPALEQSLAAAGVPLLGITVGVSADGTQ
ncbi:flagellar hook-length control protein FliK [mine drainage metagenome]|uniref:Flagellar hook-length control protein FliK n=1 Tax=mine drainage metagenome TaxID=410659 RepID=A0A1J5QS87_9ZZZZ